MSEAQGSERVSSDTSRQVPPDTKSVFNKCCFWKLPLGTWCVRLRDEVKAGSGVREVVRYQCRGRESGAGQGGSGVSRAEYGHTMAVWLRLIPLRRTSRLSKCWKREVKQWPELERKANLFLTKETLTGDLEI